MCKDNNNPPTQPQPHQLFLCDFSEADASQNSEVQYRAGEEIVVGRVVVDIGITLHSQEETIQVIDGSHACTQIDRPTAGPFLMLGGNHVSITRVGGHCEVEQPSFTQNPIVTITKHQAIVIIEEMRHLDILRQIVTHHLRELGGIKTHVAVLQANAHDEGASTEFLVLRETVGSSLGITSVIQKVERTHAVELALHTAEVSDGALVLLTTRLPVHKNGFTRVFHKISIGRKPCTCEREV